MGELAATFPNGNAATGQFCAQIIVDGPDSPDPRIGSYEVWAVSYFLLLNRSGRDFRTETGANGSIMF